MFKKFFLAISISAIILPATVLAQSKDSLVPELNPLCWKKDDCVAQRGALLNKKPEQMTPAEKDGWFSEHPCAQKDWGMCLPAGQTVTEISFGGQNKFRNIGELILVVYKYALGIGGIIAVVMIFVAGLQWVTSGGNSEMITSAKKRIGGAIMGAFLLYLSYFILSALNPALVNLRLPRVWLLKPQSLIPLFCSTVSSTGQFLLAADTSDQSSVVKLPDKPEYNLTFHNKVPADKNERNFYCGKRFFVKDGAQATCFGDYCDPDNGCVAFGDTPKGLYICKKNAVMSGTVYSSTLISPGCIAGSDGYYYPYINATGGIVDICKRKDNGNIFIDGALNGEGSLEIKNNDAKKTQAYLATLNKESLDKPCQSGNSEVVGYALRLLLVDHTCGVLPTTWWFGRNGKVLTGTVFNGDTQQKMLNELGGADLFTKAQLQNGNIIINIDVNSIPEN